MKRFQTVLFIMVVICCAAEAAFKAELIPSNQAIEGFAAAFGFSGEQKSPFEKEPEYKGSKLYGSFFMRGKQLPFVTCPSAGADQPDTIIIDLNDNKDLTDETVLTIGKPAAVQISENSSIKVVVEKYKDAPNGFIMRPAEWYKGKVALGKQEYDAVIMDLDMNGIDTKGQDCLLVDLNGDGKFEMNARALRLEGYSPLKGTVVLAGDAWDVAFDGNGPDVKLTRYAGDCGTLKIDLKMKKETGEPEIMAYVIGIDFSLLISFDKKRKDTRIPAGEYAKSMIMATIMKDGKPAAMLQCTGPQPLVINKGETKNIIIGPPDGMTVQVEQKDGKLEIARTIKSGKDAEISQMMVVGEAGQMQNLPAPSVKVISPESAEVLAEGVMKYG